MGKMRVRGFRGNVRWMRGVIDGVIWAGGFVHALGCMCWFGDGLLMRLAASSASNPCAML